MADNSTNPGVSSGDSLPPEIYDQLRAIAKVRMAHERINHTLQATALVHDALIRMAGNGLIAADARPEFFRNAAETMRRILIEHARAHRAEKRGGKVQRVCFDGVDLAGDADNSIDLLTLDEAICRLEQSAADAAAVVRLRFYAGLTVDETAEAMGVSPRTVDRLWVYARARLFVALQSGEVNGGTSDDHEDECGI